MDPAAVQLYFKSTINSFVYHYYMNNRPFFDKIKNPEQLVKEFVPGEKEWEGLVGFAKKDTINLAPVTPKGKSDVLRRIQSLMARQIWRAGGFFEVTNRHDMTIQRALAGFK
jgi:carboxyl-terminal processing protease